MEGKVQTGLSVNGIDAFATCAEEIKSGDFISFKDNKIDKKSYNFNLDIKNPYITSMVSNGTPVTCKCTNSTKISYYSDTYYLLQTNDDGTETQLASVTNGVSSDTINLCYLEDNKFLIFKTPSNGYLNLIIGAIVNNSFVFSASVAYDTVTKYIDCFSRIDNNRVFIAYGKPTFGFAVSILSINGTTIIKNNENMLQTTTSTNASGNAICSNFSNSNIVLTHKTYVSTTVIRFLTIIETTISSNSPLVFDSAGNAPSVLVVLDNKNINVYNSDNNLYTFILDIIANVITLNNKIPYTQGYFSKYVVFARCAIVLDTNKYIVIMTGYFRPIVSTPYTANRFMLYAFIIDTTDSSVKLEKVIPIEDYGAYNYSSIPFITKISENRYTLAKELNPMEFDSGNASISKPPCLRTIDISKTFYGIAITAGITGSAIKIKTV